MLADQILDETGLPYALVAFNNPPADTYVIYFDEVTRRGADTLNCITDHTISYEAYSYDFYDDEAVQAIMKALDRYAIEYRKYDTTYINSEHLYCTRFEFSFTEKDSLAERFQRQLQYEVS